MKIKTPPKGATYRLGKVVHASYKFKSAATTIACPTATLTANSVDTRFLKDPQEGGGRPAGVGLLPRGLVSDDAGCGSWQGGLVDGRR